MSNREWVMALLYFFALQSHQLCLISQLTESKSALFLCQAVSSIMSPSHDQQRVSDMLDFFQCQTVSSIISGPTESGWHYFISFPLTSSLINHVSSNRQWVTLLARQSHQSCLIPWATDSEWHCFISWPGSLINHVSSHDQQAVSELLFLHQVVSSIIPWPTASKWCCLISLSSSLIILAWPTVGESQWQYSFTGSFIMSHPMTNREWVTLVYFFSR